MAVYIKEGEIVEGMKCSVIARRVEFKKGGLRKDPITNQNMVLYELDRNCRVTVIEKMELSEEEQEIRNALGVHGEVNDTIKGDAIRLYLNTKRDSLKAIVKEGQSSTHGANLANTSIRTIGRIKTPFAVYNKLLGYSANSELKQIENE